MSTAITIPLELFIISTALEIGSLSLPLVPVPRMASTIISESIDSSWHVSSI